MYEREIGLGNKEKRLWLFFSQGPTKIGVHEQAGLSGPSPFSIAHIGYSLLLSRFPNLWDVSFL
jgi:hypothetical protein